MANKKVKIAYAMRPVETTDAQGKKVITYEKYHPVTTGNAVVVDGKTLTNKFKEYQGDIDLVVSNGMLCVEYDAATTN